MTKIKSKGAYCPDRLWHQDPSMLVVRKAAHDFLAFGKPLEETIHLHDDVSDFMLRCKVNRTDFLWLVDGDAHPSDPDHREELQRVTRYYISNSDVRLVKQMPPITRKFTKKLETLFKKHDFTPSEEQVLYITNCLKAKNAPDRTKLTGCPDEVYSELCPRVRYLNVSDGFNVTIANQLPEKLIDVNYDFYLDEARKLTYIFES